MKWVGSGFILGGPQLPNFKEALRSGLGPSGGIVDQFSAPGAGPKPAAMGGEPSSFPEALQKLDELTKGIGEKARPPARTTPGQITNQEIAGLGQKPDPFRPSGTTPKEDQQAQIANEAYAASVREAAKGRMFRDTLGNMQNSAFPAGTPGGMDQTNLSGVLGRMGRRPSGLMPNDAPPKITYADPSKDATPYSADTPYPERVNKIMTKTPIKIGFLEEPAKPQAAKSWNQWDSGAPGNTALNPAGATSPLGDFNSQNPVSPDTTPPWQAGQNVLPGKEPTAQDPYVQPTTEDSPGWQDALQRVGADLTANRRDITDPSYIKFTGYQSKPVADTSDPMLDAIRAAEAERQKALTAGSRIGMRRSPVR